MPGVVMPKDETNDQFNALKKMPKGLSTLKTRHVEPGLQTIGQDWSNDTIHKIENCRGTCYTKTVNGVDTIFVATPTSLKIQLSNGSLTLSILDELTRVNNTNTKPQQRVVMPIVDLNLMSPHIGVLIAERKGENQWSFTYIDPKWPSRMSNRLRKKLQAQYEGCTFRAIETNQQALLNDTTCGYHMLSNIEAVLTLMDEGCSPDKLKSADIRERAMSPFEKSGKIITPTSSVDRAIRKHALDEKFGLAPLPFSLLWRRAFDDTYHVQRYVDKDIVHDDFTDSDYLMGREKADETHRFNALFDLPAKTPPSIGDWVSWTIRLPITIVNNFIVKPLVMISRLNDLSLQSSVQTLKVESATASSIGIAVVSLVQALNRIAYDGLRLVTSPVNALQSALRHPLRALKKIVTPLGKAIQEAFDEVYYVKDFQANSDSKPSATDRLNAFLEWSPIKTEDISATKLNLLKLGKAIYSLISLPFNLFKTTIFALNVIKRYVGKQLTDYKRQHQTVLENPSMRLGEASFRKDGELDSSRLLTRPPLPIFNFAIGAILSFVTNFAYETPHPAMMPKAYWRSTWDKTKNIYAKNGINKALAVGYITLRSLRFLGSNIAVGSLISAALPFIFGKVAIKAATTAIAKAMPVMSKVFNTFGIQAARISGQVAVTTLAGAISVFDAAASALFQTVRHVSSRILSKKPRHDSGADPLLSEDSDEDDFVVVDQHSLPASPVPSRPASPVGSAVSTQPRLDKDGDKSKVVVVDPNSSSALLVRSRSGSRASTHSPMSDEAIGSDDDPTREEANTGLMHSGSRGGLFDKRDNHNRHPSSSSDEYVVLEPDNDPENRAGLGHQ